MFGWLKRSKETPRTEVVEHALLGTLRFDPELDAWRTVAGGAGAFGFLIGGADSPDERLLAHAADVAADPAAFLEHVRSFLLAEAARQPRWAEEIASLSLEEVCLFWPNRSDDGMLYFKGPDTSRVWRSDYRNRVPEHLGFDS